MNTLVRDNLLAKKIVLIDGYSASGKSLLQKFIQTFDSVEKFEMSHFFGDIAKLNYLNKIDDDAAKILINIYADNYLYSSMLSRNTNFRPFDDSSVFKNYHTFEYIKRLFLEDGDKAKDRVLNLNPVLSIMTHFGLVSSRIMFEAFGDRLSYFSIVRHPVYILDHWEKYIDRIGIDEREFSICIKDNNGKNLPWFALGWEDEYSNLSTTDKAIKSILHINNITKESISESKYCRNINTIPFEKFITNTGHYINIIENSLGKCQTKHTQAFLKNNNLPSKNFSGRYAKRGVFGWKIHGTLDNNTDYLNRLAKIEKNASKDIFQELLIHASEYETEHSLEIGLDLK